jgi:outer membrane PBP1 activator LpoA protein
VLFHCLVRIADLILSIEPKNITGHLWYRQHFFVLSPRAVCPYCWRLFFAGCGTHTQDQSTAFMQGTSQANSSFYLQQMQQSTNDSKTNWQLLAIRALLQEGKKQQAIDLFNQLPSNLTAPRPVNSRCWR